MNDISILNLMIKDHNSLMQNLKDIEENVNKDKSYITRSFNNFKWNLEKHFFVEERAIFTKKNSRGSILDSIRSSGWNRRQLAKMVKLGGVFVSQAST